MSLQDFVVPLVQAASLAALVVVADAHARRLTQRWPGEIQQLALGALFGLCGVLSMMAPTSAGASVPYDGRSIIMIAAAAFTGPAGAVAAALPMLVYRVALGSELAGLLSILVAGLVGIVGCAMVRRRGGHVTVGALLTMSLAVSLAIPLAQLVVQGVDAVLAHLQGEALPRTAARVAGVLLTGTLLLQERRRREVEEALQQSERRFAAITTQVPGAIYQYTLRPDGTGGFTYASEGIQELWGIGPGELVNNSTIATQRLHPDDVGRRHEAMIRSAAALTVWDESFRVVRPDGSVRWLRSTGRPHRRANGETVWDGFILDITEQMRREWLLLRAKEAAEAANKAKSQFLANMSHELRTPLNSIIGFAELMQQQIHGALGHDRYQDYITHVVNGGRHLLRLINDVLDLAKVEAGQMTLAEEPFDLRGLVGEVMRMLAPRATQAGLALHSQVADEVAGCDGDALRLKQALLNLLANAIKFTPGGGAASVTADLDDEGRLRLAVADTGIGIAPEDMARLFVPFGQAGDVYTRSTEGSGLGLVIARQIVELHGGTLTLDSAPGRGTTALITLPARRVIHRAAAASASRVA